MIEMIDNMNLDIAENPFYLKFVKNQTEKLCLEIVQKTGMTVKYVINQTPLICLEAMKKNKDVYVYIHKHILENLKLK